MNLEESCIRFFQKLNDDFTKVHPLVFASNRLLKLQVLAVSTKHANKCDLDKEIRSLLYDIDLMFLGDRPAILNSLNRNLFNNFDHIFKLVLVKCGTQCLALLLPHKIGLRK